MYKQIQIKSIVKEGEEQVVLGEGSKDVVVRMTINKVDVNGAWGIKDWMLRVWMADTEDFANKEWRRPFSITRKRRNELYRQVTWERLMARKSIQWLEWEWNHAALRALLLVLAATHHKDFSEFTLDLQNDRWWHDSAPLDAEPVGPHVPRVTDAPRRPSRRSPKRSDMSSSSTAPSDANGSPTCGALRPRVLFRTSRLSEEPELSARLGSKQRPHRVVDGDCICDGTGHAHITAGAAAQQWGWELYDIKNDECPYNHVGKESEHTMEDDNGLPLDPLWPISPMSGAEEPVTPIYVEE